ncbi:hypothetical protein D3C78_1126960 [compost metagenome]
MIRLRQTDQNADDSVRALPFPASNREAEGLGPEQTRRGLLFYAPDYSLSHHPAAFIIL